MVRNARKNMLFDLLLSNVTHFLCCWIAYFWSHIRPFAQAQILNFRFLKVSKRGFKKGWYGEKCSQKHAFLTYFWATWRISCVVRSLSFDHISARLHKPRSLIFDFWRCQNEGSKGAVMVRNDVKSMVFWTYFSTTWRISCVVRSLSFDHIFVRLHKPRSLIFDF